MGLLTDHVGWVMFLGKGHSSLLNTSFCRLKAPVPQGATAFPAAAAEVEALSPGTVLEAEFAGSSKQQ